jgi:hypothetical protein
MEDETQVARLGDLIDRIDEDLGIDLGEPEITGRRDKHVERYTESMWEAMCGHSFATDRFRRFSTALRSRLLTMTVGDAMLRTAKWCALARERRVSRL